MISHVPLPTFKQMGTSVTKGHSFLLDIGVPSPEALGFLKETSLPETVLGIVVDSGYSNKSQLEARIDELNRFKAGRASLEENTQQAFRFEHIREVAEMTKKPVVVKGILCAEDAVECAQAGA
jgi:isopentenyl diphosphate isomerase/L-lactate dehydrogenase-like FMN-dependent dehydrogenase